MSSNYFQSRSETSYIDAPPERLVCLSISHNSDSSIKESRSSLNCGIRQFQEWISSVSTIQNYQRQLSAVYKPLALGHPSVCLPALLQRTSRQSTPSATTFLSAFDGAVEYHFDSLSGHPSIFISLFAGRQHADNWALRYSDPHGGEICTVYEISAAMLAGSYVFCADELRRGLCLQVSEQIATSMSDEYLVAHHIPFEAIVGCRTTDDIRRGEGCFLPDVLYHARSRQKRAF
jgi:hypothetical protein